MRLLKRILAVCAPNAQLSVIALCLGGACIRACRHVPLPVVDASPGEVARGGLVSAQQGYMCLSKMRRMCEVSRYEHTTHSTRDNHAALCCIACAQAHSCRSDARSLDSKSRDLNARSTNHMCKQKWEVGHQQGGDEILCAEAGLHKWALTAFDAVLPCVLWSVQNMSIQFYLCCERP